jgi:hypothetical protein
MSSTDPVSAVASWLIPISGDAADPLPAMVAEQARLQEEAATLEDEAEELLSSLSRVSVQFAGETVTVASEVELRSFIRRRESLGIALWRVFLEGSPNYDIRKTCFTDHDPTLKNPVLGSKLRKTRISAAGGLA